MNNIKKFNDFLNENETVTNVLKGILTPKQIDSVIHEDDLNTAMYDIQNELGVTDSGVYFSKFDDADEHWKNSTIEERRVMLGEYLDLESDYSSLDYENDLNEELDASTYASAAEKLRRKGHSGRADKLETFAKSKIEPAEVTLNNEKFIVLPENIQLMDLEPDLWAIWIVINRYLFPGGDPNNEDDWDEDGINIDIKKFNNDEWGVEVSGLILKDRKSARSIHKLVTQWAKSQDNQIIKDNIQKLIINDLYE